MSVILILPNAGGRFIKYPRSTAACERNAVDSRPYHASPTVGRAIVLMEINGAAPMVRRQLDHQDQNEAGQSQNQGSKQYQARQTFTLPGFLGGPSNLYVRSGHSFRFPVSDGVSRDRISLARSFPRAVLNGKALGKRPFRVRFYTPAYSRELSSTFKWNAAAPLATRLFHCYAQADQSRHDDTRPGLYIPA